MVNLDSNTENWMAVDVLMPIHKKTFDKNEMQEVMKHTGEFEEQVFVFDILELRIISFYETQIQSNKGLIIGLSVQFSNGEETVLSTNMKKWMANNGLFNLYNSKVKFFFPEIRNNNLN
jgi:hypothetical protein